METDALRRSVASGIGGSLSPIGSYNPPACHCRRFHPRKQGAGKIVPARAVASGMNTTIHLGNRVGFGCSKSSYSLPASLLTRHCYVIGKTGTGKTTLLQNAVCSLIRQGRGVGVIDPHGDFAAELLNVVPPDRIDEVIYLDPSDPTYSPAINLVSSTARTDDRPLIASALVAAFRHIWSESWGPRMEYILYNALRVLLDSQNTSLVALPRLLSDSDYRRSLVKQCQDPFVRHFWEQEFDCWDERFRREAIAPIQNKLGQFTTMPPLRHVLGQVPLRIDFRGILDSGKILIVNLSKGRLGDDASRLLGALITAFISSVAMGRANLPAAQRRDFVLFIDEAQNFLSDALASILSESRKYGLGLVLSHQFLDQLPPRLQSAVLGNAGTTICFALCGEDAQRFEVNFGGSFPASRFTDLAPYTALMRAADDTRFPFLLESAPPTAVETNSRRRILHRCQQHYCSLRTAIEERMIRFLR
jgi:hypothetical protein